MLPSTPRPALLALLLLFAPAARAQQGSEASPPSQTSPETQSPDDQALQRELERALQQDAAKNKPSEQGTALPSAPADQGTSQPSSGTRWAQSLNPSISLIGDFALAAFGSPTPNELGGHDPAENGFNLQSLELAFGAAVDPYFRFDANLAFGREHSFEIEEAYATTLALPANLQLRMGQFLTRIGRINTQHTHAWDFADQPLVIGKILGPDGNRAPGAELSVLLGFVPWYTELVLSANQATGPGARSFLGEEPPRAVKDVLDVQYLAALKQFWALSDDLSLAWGLSAMTGPNANGAQARTDIFATDLYVKYRPIGEASTTVVAFTWEALVRQRRDLEGLPVRELVDGGTYAQLFWRFAQRWGTAVRGEWVSGASDDPTDPGWTRPRYRASGALTFWPTEFSRVRLQANYDRSLSEDSAVPSVFLAVEFASGAHGAHTF